MNFFSCVALFGTIVNHRISFSHPYEIAHPFNIQQRSSHNIDLFKNVSRMNYFSFLDFNFDYNFSTYCNYIALEEILCFYDTYLNDTLIPEEYDVPGFVETINQYEQKIEYISTDSFGSPGVGCSYNYTNLYEQRLNSFNPNNFLEHMMGCSVDFQYGIQPYLFAGAFAEVTQRLNLSSYFDFETIFAEMFSDDPLSFQEEIVSYLEQGYPVVAEIYGGNPRHTVVIYGTDGTNFYYNNGYSERTNDSIPTFGVCDYTDIFVAYIIKPNEYLTHVCSNNYILNDDTSICPCLLQGYNYFENHTHTYTTLNNTYHLESCPSCSRNRAVPHTFDDPSSIYNSHHSSSCIYCQEEVNQNHSIISYTSNGQYSHLITMDDGCQLEEDHYMYSIECYGGQVHKVTCVCNDYYLNHHYPFLVLVDGLPGAIILDDYDPDFNIDFLGLEGENLTGWICMCGYSNTLSVSANSAEAIINYVLENYWEELL